MNCFAGVKSGKIKDPQMTASSQLQHTPGYEPHQARLDGPRGWTPEENRQSNGPNVQSSFLKVLIQWMQHLARSKII